ncbi:MAG: hypothetical protein ACREVA_00015 [Burkholderiales bacterium]
MANATDTPAIGLTGEPGVAVAPASAQEILDAPASNAMILAMVLQWRADHAEIECMKNRIDELEQMITATFSR